jgi:hypothetical protein
VRRIAVKARETGARPDWMVFALTNDTDESASGLSSRSGRMPWLAVIAAMREPPRSGQTTPEDGIVRRIAVKARETGARPDWMVFALTNDTDEQIDRLLVCRARSRSGSGRRPSGSARSPG